MAGLPILLVVKRPLIERLDAVDIRRLDGSGAIDHGTLTAAAESHRGAMTIVRAALAGHRVVERRVDELRPGIGADCALVITVGGDGTVFAAHAHVAGRPMLCVNSDPERSVGHFTRCLPSRFADVFATWLGGAPAIEAIPRLQVVSRSWDRPRPFLNDCLFSSRNPAAMTRYHIACGRRQERHHSSGVWIATAAGSTGGIRSAGLDPGRSSGPALLFKVREPYPGRGPMALLSGRQRPPRGLSLTSAMTGIELYIDGPYQILPVPPGETVSFSAAPEPLVMVVDRGGRRGSRSAEASQVSTRPGRGGRSGRQ